MPELPEVETVRRTLQPHLAGRTIAGVHVGEYQRCVATPDVEEFRERLIDSRITRVGRRGKFILLHLSTSDVVTIHLRMTGEVSIVDPVVPADAHVHLWLDLENGKQVRYRDVRKFGRWSLLTENQYAIFDDSIGPEPLEPELTAEKFTAMLQGRKRILKPLLLDQQFLAGVGNIYADEALYRAGIHPRRHSCDLSANECERLLHEIRLVLSSALEHRGTTLRDYRDGNGEPGENLSRLQIYSRSVDDPCHRCGTPIVRELIGQRGTKICPTCQPI
ncbi:MAG: bifunctional DNA-formamidopyrimidine glycosylase/DNA-(apurinic or apyrimidinic site) lyase [Sphaerobacteraceae bacterium]|nr:MAG: bifunctional DNA-formamidopyrimidine glycosylase/DNA-(apurinic or apyrimidinic site) lyase [Sphaerobacteraceae bacterium]